MTHFASEAGISSGEVGDASNEAGSARELLSERDHAAGATANESEKGDEAIVSTSRHCEACEHLSDPPVFRCTHGEARILEFVDRDHVRVRDCPVAEPGNGSE